LDIKPWDNFYYIPGKRCYQDFCRVCKAEKQREYRSKPEIIAQYNKLERKEYKKEKDKEYYENPKNKERILKRRKEYREEPGIKEKEKEYQKEYRVNPEKIENIRKSKREWERMKRENDVGYRIKASLRSRIYDAIKNNRKSAHTMELIGCSMEFLEDWLEYQFDADMNWNNYGSWTIDHIKPCASFDLSSEEEQKVCFHWTNLRPLEAGENSRKKDYYDDEIKNIAEEILRKFLNNEDII
jgi:hypothetical protein